MAVVDVVRMASVIIFSDMAPLAAIAITDVAVRPVLRLTELAGMPFEIMRNQEHAGRRSCWSALVLTSSMESMAIGFICVAAKPVSQPMMPG
jgi:hypothetical protein